MAQVGEAGAGAAGDLVMQLMAPLVMLALILYGLSLMFGGLSGTRGAFNWVGRGIAWTITRAVIFSVLFVINTVCLIMRIAVSPHRAGEHFGHYVERMADALLGRYGW